MEGLLPVDPVVQKERILRKYERDFAAASAKFTDNIKERTINLLKYVSGCILLCCVDVRTLVSGRMWRESVSAHSWFVFAYIHIYASVRRSVHHTFSARAFRF